MTEEIIVDRVNVAGCSLYLKDNGKCLRLLTDEEQETECNAICDYGSLYRKEQLQRLKQENEKLKKQLDSYAISATVPTVMYNRVEIERCKYGKALEEIREIINEVCWDYTDITILPIKDKILNKINEVLNESK